MNLSLFLGVALGIMSLAVLPALAHPHQDYTSIDDHDHDAPSEITPIDGLIGLEKTTLVFHVPENNNLPWGFVEGKIANHVPDHDVIIQIFKTGDPVHFAQTHVNEDGTYEYKFRVRDDTNGKITKPFVGDYTVIVYKVVYLDSLNSV